MKLIDVDTLKEYFSWWSDDNEKKRIFLEIIDAQPIIEVPPSVGALDGDKQKELTKGL